MCGDYHSVIGMDKVEPMRRFVTGMPKASRLPAGRGRGDAFAVCYVETDDQTGQARPRVEPVRRGRAIAPDFGAVKDDVDARLASLIACRWC